MMKKIVVLICVLMLVFSLSACKKDNDEEPYEEIPVNGLLDSGSMRNTVLYFEDEYGYIVPTMRQIAWVEGIGKESLENLKSDADKNVSFGEK